MIPPSQAFNFCLMKRTTHVTATFFFPDPPTRSFFMVYKNSGLEQKPSSQMPKGFSSWCHNRTALKTTASWCHKHRETIARERSSNALRVLNHHAKHSITNPFFLSTRMGTTTSQEPKACNKSSRRKLQMQSKDNACLLYTSPSPRDKRQSRMPSSA